MSRGLRRAAIALVVLIGLVTPAAADTATERVRAFFANVNRLIADPAYDDRLPARLEALRALVADIVDFRAAAATALGSEWATRTPGEREEFVRLFTDLLQTSVFSSVGGRARVDNGLTVTYIGELSDTGGVTVATSVLTRNGAEMAVGYRMALRDGFWMAHDVVIDGVSLVENYRAQFQKVIARSSYGGLVSEMRTRLAELGRPVEPATAFGAPGTIVTAAPPTTVAVPREDAASPEPVPVAPSATPSVVVAAVPPAAPIAEPRVSEPRVEDSERAPGSSPSVTIIPPRLPRTTDYWVQVGAFRNVEKAMRVASALRDHAVTLVTTPEQPLMRVLVGPFTDRGAATAKLREIRARGYDGFIAEASR